MRSNNERVGIRKTSNKKIVKAAQTTHHWRNYNIFNEWSWSLFIFYSFPWLYKKVFIAKMVWSIREWFVNKGIWTVRALNILYCVHSTELFHSFFDGRPQKTPRKPAVWCTIYAHSLYLPILLLDFLLRWCFWVRVREAVSCNPQATRFSKPWITRGLNETQVIMITLMPTRTTVSTHSELFFWRIYMTIKRNPNQTSINSD